MKRAHDEAARDERRNAILGAAEKLLIDGGGDLPSVARIAAAAGLAKGTIYLYFSTKEEILAAVLRGLWTPMLAAFEEEFAAVTIPLAERVRTFAERFADYCERHAHLMRLDALSKEVIERNMCADALAEHKAALETLLRKTGTRMEAALGLPECRGFQVMARLHGLMRGLWQSFGDQEQDLTASPTSTFAIELREATAEYLDGALGSGPVVQAGRL